MKFEKHLLEEQEVTINIIYLEEIIIIYANRKEVIQNLTEQLGKPTKKYKRGKTYWTAAEWRLDFSQKDIISKILNNETFIDEKLKIKKINRKEKEDFKQIKLEL
ncbi:MAG: hypothetical protein Q4G09_06600 [Clostridia bacterium]|nr:hypothetical protein [Clostridia bacterium]